MKTNDPPSPGPSKPATGECDAFSQLTRRLMAVPKAEIDRREAEYQKQQAKKPKRGPKAQKPD